MFLVTHFIVALSISVLGGYFYLLQHDEQTASTLGWLPITSLVIFVTALDLGISPVAIVVSNEVLPAKLKAQGSSVSAFVMWLMTFITTKTYVDLQAALSPAGALWFYGAFCILGLLFGRFLMPETRGKSPDEIENLFRKNSSKA